MTDKEKLAEKDTVIGCFGWIVLTLFAILFLTIAIFSKHECEIITKERIEPEQVLTTEGKVVDTLYIYKQK